MTIVGQITWPSSVTKKYHSVCGSNQFDPFYLTLSNKNQLVPYDDSVYTLFCLYWLQALKSIHITLYKSMSTAFEFLKQIYLFLLAFMREVGGNLNYIFKALTLSLIFLIASFSSFVIYQLWIRNKILPLN